MTPTPEPAMGAVSWNMNTTCNYRCSYCTQRFMDDRGRWARDVPRFINAFQELPGRWEVKLSGGEPFTHPHFDNVVAALSQRGFLVSVVTNFHSPRDELDRFMDAAGPNLGIISCSLHLEYVAGGAAIQDFIGRALHVQRRLPPGATLCVTCVATRSALPTLPGLAQAFGSAGITFKVQPEKQDGDVIAYSEGEHHQLLQLGGHNGTGMVAACFEGRPCWAGSRYFILDDRGNAFRCYPARRRRMESLGNLLDGTFHLMSGANPCVYNYCNCTVPIARGMMPLREQESAGVGGNE
jgi:hypothetical protein